MPGGHDNLLFLCKNKPDGSTEEPKRKGRFTYADLYAVLGKRKYGCVVDSHAAVMPESTLAYLSNRPVNADLNEIVTLLSLASIYRDLCCSIVDSKHRSISNSRRWFLCHTALSSHSKYPWSIAKSLCLTQTKKMDMEVTAV
jgi:hypothetical protein